MYAIVLCFVRDLWGTGHLSEGSFVRNVVVQCRFQIPKFYAKPNPNLNSKSLTFTFDSPSPRDTTIYCIECPCPIPSPSPNPLRIRFGKMTLRTSELLPIYDAVLSF